MEVLLKFTKVGKAEYSNNANNGRRVSMQTLGHRADAEKHESAGMFEHWTENFLALCGEVTEAFLQND